MATAATIDDVLLRLDAIVDDARTRGHRGGYFAALYRGVTARVRDDVRAGRFDDPARMERLDVVFANRYLDAEAARRAGRPTTRCWRIAFDEAERWPPLVLQHLLLGMTAHIALDLGVAAAEVAPGDALAALQGDFLRIDALLGAMIDDVQERVATVSPWMGVLDRIGDRTDEVVCGFCLAQARALAWSAAEALAPMDDPAARDAAIARLDLRAAALATAIRTPGPLARVARLGVRLTEPRDVRRVLDVLDARTR